MVLGSVSDVPETGIRLAKAALCVLLHLLFESASLSMRESSALSRAIACPNGRMIVLCKPVLQYFDFLQPGSLHEIAEFFSCSKRRRSPNRITQLSTKAAVRSPQAPVSEFSNHKSRAGLEHAGHSRGRSLGIANEAKHGHRNHMVKRSIVERQVFDLPLDDRIGAGGISMRRRAAAIIAGSESSPVTIAPRRASSDPSSPSPQPTSSKVFPAIGLTSSKGSCCSSASVIRPKRLDRHRK